MEQKQNQAVKLKVWAGPKNQQWLTPSLEIAGIITHTSLSEHDTAGVLFGIEFAVNGNEHRPMRVHIDWPSEEEVKTDDHQPVNHHDTERLVLVLRNLVDAAESEMASNSIDATSALRDYVKNARLLLGELGADKPAASQRRVAL